MSAKPKLPKQPLQTISERLTKEEIKWLCAFLSKKGGAAAKVWVIKGACEGEMIRRGIKRQPALIHDHQDAIKDLRLLMHTNGAAMADIAKGEKWASDKLANPAFVSAIRACAGVNEFFGDEAQEAIEKRKIGFFRSTMEAVETYAKRGKTSKDSDRMMMHVRAGHAVAFRLIKEGKPDPTIGEFEAMVEDELDAIGILGFSDPKSWVKVREACGMSHLKQAFQGRKPVTMGGKHRQNKRLGLG